MANFTKSWQMEVGLNHVPAYQVSGQPFASGSINAIATATATKISFPYVTRWIYVTNNSTTATCKVGFSELGLAGTNYFTVGKGVTSIPVTTERFELKVSELWITGSGDVDIVAGLTSVPTSRTTTSAGTSWSGSSGVG